VWGSENCTQIFRRIMQGSTLDRGAGNFQNVGAASKLQALEE
jgi:hypothetical protein